MPGDVASPGFPGVAEHFRPTGRVGSMTQGFDLVEGVAAGLEDRAEAWWFVEDFARHWVAPLTDTDGWSEADLVAAEQRLGLRLPAALREAYGLFGRRRDLTASHDVLLCPADLHVDDLGVALVFRHENQGAAAWGVLLTELHRPDPAVAVRMDATGAPWQGWLDRLSVAFVELVLSESLHAPADRSDFLDALDEKALRLVEEQYVQLPFPAYPTSAVTGGSRWFAGADVLLREDDGAVLLVRTRTVPALDELRAAVPGDWLNA